ncbi:S24/S26 family peptidase [Mesoterricola sediminis]|uniref:Peptidase S24/S26A/S26B/S26C domain-containing protein n=1 Tax=Mesoterricola sediminis TaxID=2927980 RepID=A0AA48HCU9_9BACT|nr:S24/S26 family peptidase [Mesoterricola sediminis]BDU75933.1 hypothetical protein METESE_08910 [Mesoterricola sediminis]
MRRDEALRALRSLLDAGRPCTVDVRGVSMEPFLRAGDRVRVERADPGRLALGDLVAFEEDGNLIVHRFAGWTGARGGRWFRQTGDNMIGFGLVPSEALLGRVTALETGSGVRRLDRGWAGAACRLRGLRVLAARGLRAGLGRALAWRRR